MRITSLAKMMVGVENVVVEGVEWDDGRQAVVIDARPYKPHACRCGRCGRKAPRYDGGQGVRLWRCCDLGGTRVFVRAEAFRVACPDCGVTVRRVPCAAYGSWFTYAFEDTCCWCALSMSKKACCELMRVAWRTVGDICARVLARLEDGMPPRTSGLVRKGEVANPERKAANAVKGLRYPLLKNPEDLTERQAADLELAAISSPRLYRAYLLKEGLRLALKLPADQTRDAVEAWRGRAWRSRIPEFVELQRKVKRHMDAIVATAAHGLTNARVEAVNNKIKLIVKMAYGFRNTDNLFAMVMLKCSGLEVPLPGRL